jgi:MerR family transcriptional regulator, light-induced transcriptional regulator
LSEAYLHIGNVAQRTGVPEATLRAWERRYAVLLPERSGGGQRLYTDEDVDRVQRMRELIDGGLRASQAARLVGGDDRSRAAVALAPDDGAGCLAGSLVDAIARFDEPRAHAVLDEALSRLSLVAAIDTVVAPAMQTVGELWASGELGVDGEHFGAQLVRGRLVALARQWGAGAGPLAVAACAPAEEHDIPLILLCLGLREDGWRIRYLGARTPVDDLARTVARDRPRLTLVSASTADGARSFRRAGLDDGMAVMTGGAGFAEWTRTPLRETVAALRPYGFTGS